MQRRTLLVMAAAAFLAGCNKGAEAVPAAQGVERPTQPVVPAGLAPKDEVEFAYALEIPNDQGVPITVQDTFKFRSGERFRLQWKSNFAAYVYVFNRGPQTTVYSRLYPVQDQASMVGATTDSVARIPKGASDWLRFDKNTGNEQLVIVAAREAIPALEKPTERYSVEEFDRILIALERSRRPNSLRRFDEGNWHKNIAAGPAPGMAVVNRLPLYHE